MFLFFNGFSKSKNDSPTLESWPGGEIETLIKKFRLQEAENQILKISEPAIRDYYLCKIRFFQILTTDDNRYFSSFDSICEKGLHSVLQFPASPNLRHGVLAELYLQRAMVKYFQGKTMATALDLRRACDQAFSTQPALKGESKSHHKVLGLFHVALSSIPDNLKWLGNILCEKGDFQKGVQLLESASSEADLFPEEAEIILFYIEKNFLGQPELAYKRAKRLFEKDPTNYIFNFIYALSCFETGNTDMARTILEKQNQWNDGRFFTSPFWELYLGRACLFQLDLKKADKHIGNFIKIYKGETYLADACFKKGICQMLQGNDVKAAEEFKITLLQKETGFDSDYYSKEMATKYLSKLPGSISQKLWKSRMLFDGGYFNRSIEMLFPLSDSISLMNLEEKTEYYYRFGRNYLSKGNIKMAHLYLNSCVGTGAIDNKWMCANASYYLGKLEESQGKSVEARNWYKKVFTFKDYFYQSSLESRTKAALQMMDSRLRNPQSTN